MKDFIKVTESDEFIVSELGEIVKLGIFRITKQAKTLTRVESE